jgi:hypothetical protein
MVGVSGLVAYKIETPDNLKSLHMSELLVEN